MTAKWQPPDRDDLLSRYLGGESEKALAEAHGVSRTAIRRVIVEEGVEPRGRPQSMVVRMARTSSEERQRLTAAAHAAVRGSHLTADQLSRRARGVERTQANTSPAERILQAMLEERGLIVSSQKAIGPYNADLAAGSVAVEVLGGTWHRTKRHGKRLGYFLDHGWDVIYVWVDGIHYPLSPSAAEDIAAQVERRDRDPAAPRRYRVIRGSGELIAIGEGDLDQIPDKVPFSSRPEVPPVWVPAGTCACGCGKSTSLSNGRHPNGQPKGSPNRFVTGHNHSCGPR